MNRQVDIKSLVSHIVRGDGMNKCRICMGDTSQGQVHLTDTVMMDGDKAVTLSELLEVITGVEVDEDAILPPGLCRACAEDVVTAAKFKHLYEKSAYRWSEAAAYLSKINFESEDRTLFLMFEDNDMVLCEKKVDTVQSAITTLKQFNKVEKQKKPRREFACACPYCDKPFTSFDLLNDHLKHGQKRVCCECGLVIAKSGISKHMLDAHQIETVECKICHELFSSYGDENWHMMQYHGPNSLSCKNCGRGYKNERGLRAHWYSHSLFNCVSCGQSFENNRCYRHHRTNCKSMKSEFSYYECHDCGLRYDKKPSLKIHIVQKHLNVLPFVCTTCGKRTSTSAHLRSHERVHDKDRKTVVCHCGAKFRTELGHRLHMRTHSGIKPYKCSQCEETFISASRRLDHTKRRHKSTKDLAHGCDQCSARFIRPCELKKHYAQCHRLVVCVPPTTRTREKQQSNENFLQ